MKRKHISMILLTILACSYVFPLTAAYAKQSIKQYQEARKIPATSEKSMEKDYVISDPQVFTTPQGSKTIMHESMIVSNNPENLESVNRFNNTLSQKEFEAYYKKGISIQDIIQAEDISKRYSVDLKSLLDEKLSTTKNWIDIKDEKRNKKKMELLEKLRMKHIGIKINSTTIDEELLVRYFTDAKSGEKINEKVDKLRNKGLVSLADNPHITTILEKFKDLESCVDFLIELNGLDLSGNSSTTKIKTYEYKNGKIVEVKE